jgi:hypothetical protein
MSQVRKPYVKAVLFSMLCLVSLATSAAAECAWVLWDWRDNSGWTTTGVYPSYSKCWAKIHQHTGISEEGSFSDWIDWIRRLGRYDERMRGIDVGHMKATDLYIGARESGAVVISAQTITEYRCLPDTIDPRGPKGK